MRINGNYFTITNKVKFDGKFFNSIQDVKKAFDFAYDMSFGHKGEHRCNRTGGIIERTKGQIFINTFQGKLAELAFYNFMSNRGFKISYPDFQTYNLGIWGGADFVVADNNRSYLFSIKSTKFYGNLMLLETEDYNANGQYVQI